MATLNFSEASRDGLREEMHHDATVWALGEDLGKGGIFSQYEGLFDEFGPERIVDTPISEATIMGAAVGAAMAGTRPVVEMRFSDFALCAVDELVNQAAKARYMFGGQCRVPLVARQPVGIAHCHAAQHSQSLEAWWVHIPGLVVIAPATPADNKGLIKSAIRCDDPVVYLEHKGLWELTGEVPDVEDWIVPIGEARVARQGDDITIVTWSSMVQVAEKAADIVAKNKISAEVLDLRTLWPWDEEKVCESVCKTGRVLIVHEAVQVAGFGAEIFSTIVERVGSYLKKPAHRIGGPRIPVPYSPPLENLCLVSSDQIADTIKTLM
jgi:pyruvate dehydrogenase E1 component beta subunit